MWNKLAYDFEATVQECISYYKTHGNLNIPIEYVSRNGVNLNYWIAYKRQAYRNGKLSDKQIAALKQAHII
jgi:hypothetical protein